MARTRRENWRHKYYVVIRDEKGRFLHWHKWKRSDPTTWIKRPVVPEVGWRKTVLSYECGKPPTYSSWHIDLTKVSLAETSSDAQQESYCFEMLARAFTKALRAEKAGDRVIVSRNWDVDLPKSKYPPYAYLQDVLDSKGIEFKSVVEHDGKGEEEVLELWRCSR